MSKAIKPQKKVFTGTRKSQITLAVIGGGSSQWMTALMRDVYLLNEVDGGAIRLVDPRQEHVQAVADMLRTFNKARGKHFTISVVEDRKEALKGCDFVMTTFSPGSMDAFEMDLELPMRYGIRQPVSMTVGPSGISASLRTAPVAYEIVQDMEQVCPGAWLLNVTNPMSVVTRAMYMAARTVKVLGMCHEFHGMSGIVKRMVKLPPMPEGMPLREYQYDYLPSHGFEYTAAGVNHFVWLTQARLHGRDVIPAIRKFAAEHAELKPVATKDTRFPWWQNFHAAKLAYCRTFGYLPIAGDRHLIEFWPHFCNMRNGFGMKYNVVKTTVDGRRAGVANALASILRITAGEEQVDWTKKSGEEMTEVMRAILNGTSLRTIVNCPNQGQITNLPPDAMVETLGVVSPDGVKADFAGELPGAVGSLCRLHVDVHELTVRAALEGSRDLFVQAMSLDPLSATADFAEIGQLADELLQANRAWLPRFFK